MLFAHGLWMTGAESAVLAQRLLRQQLHLRVFRYSSILELMPRLIERGARFAAQLVERYGAPVHFVGHSLGGLVLYRMFESGALCRAGVDLARSRVVFLGTPSVGSQLGDSLATTRMGRWFLGRMAAAELLRNTPRRWDFEAPLGVIAGDRPLGMGRMVTHLTSPNDGTVAVAETKLAGASAHRVLHVTHSGLLLSAEVARETAAFLTTGAFLPMGPR